VDAAACWWCYQLPTTGKTVIFSHLVREQGGPTLVLAHRHELIAQTEDKIRMLSPGIDIGCGRRRRGALVGGIGG